MRALLAIIATIGATIGATGLASAQSPDTAPSIPGLETLPPASQLLARIRTHMADILTHQPNYTCLETVERSYRAAGARRLQLDDTIRMEVALVDGKEMFAWPGSKKFEETDLRKLIPSGAFGNGNFALHARSVFLGRVATFDYRGEELLVGSTGPLVRYDFHVPRLVSGYTIRMEERTGIAGYHGSFWADKETLDVRRLEVIAEDIPPDLGVTAASDRVDYARLPIGTGEFLLPVESQLNLADKYNLESQNRVHFTSCRQYTGESTLKFDDPDSTPAASPGTAVEPPETDLPAGLKFALTLDQDLDVDTAAVGDPVRAHLNSDLRRKGEVLAGKSATAHGRITRLERREGFTILGITLTAIETGTSTLHVNANLEEVVGIQFVSPPRNVRIQPGPAQPGEGLIVLRAGHVRLIRGILMYWRT